MEPVEITRRRLVAGMLLPAVPGALRRGVAWRGGPAGRFDDPATARLSSLEREIGGRLGVFAVDGARGRAVGWRSHERFPMCSVYKVVAAAAVLARVDSRSLALDRRIPLTPADILEYAPASRRHLADGYMTVEAAVRAAVRESDNTAANLLTDLVGGPPGWTRYVRSLSDLRSRLDRTEPRLNEAAAGDPRDTTTPAAICGLLSAILLGDALSSGSLALLLNCMADAELTRSLFQAALPTDWRVFDKSGAGGNGTRNDVGMVRAGDSPPIVLSVFLTQCDADAPRRDAAVARAAGIAASSLRGGPAIRRP